MKAAILQKRTLAVMILLVLGGSIAAAAAIGGDPSGAVVLAAFYVLSGVGVWLWSGRSGDVAALLRSGGDERQRSLDLRATAISGLAMGAFAIAGTIVQLARVRIRRCSRSSAWSAALRTRWRLECCARG